MSEEPPAYREYVCERCGNKLDAREIEALAELERLFKDLRRGRIVCEKCSTEPRNP